jgi:hypothetical protein
MELDCVLFNNPVRYDGLDNDDNYPITILTENDDYLYLTEEGYLYNMPNSKCVIFPKGKTTWKGFVPPFRFKDGDVLVHTQNQRFVISIFHKRVTEITIKTHCVLWDINEKLGVNMDIFCYPDKTRLATEEEKQKLFQAIKDNGYKWNEETKTLEKLPKFKVGDRVRHKTHARKGNIVTEIKDTHYILDDELALPFINQDDYELVPNKFVISNVSKLKSLITDYETISHKIRENSIEFIKEILDNEREVDLSEFENRITYYGETFYVTFIKYDEYGNVIICVDGSEPFMYEDLTTDEIIDICDSIVDIFGND